MMATLKKHCLCISKHPQLLVVMCECDEAVSLLAVCKLFTHVGWRVQQIFFPGKSHEEARHWSDDSTLEGRAFFR